MFAARRSGVSEERRRYLLRRMRPSAETPCAVLASFILFTLTLQNCGASGVTVITHGYSGDANGWVAAMADAIPSYPAFPGSNFTIFKVTLTTDGNGNYFYQSERTNGVAPSVSDSGEIIVKMDWSQMAGGTALYDISTDDVAWVATWVLMQTNAIAELGGHALAEFPIHLIGHSRGGSLVSETSRLLGTNGVWVDHLTTLDPHPLNNDGFIDPIFVTDAPVRTYENVLFHDNYWEDINTYPWGEATAGAYVRPLNNSLSSDPSGYGSNYHSDVHLWYHGTVNLNTPAGYNYSGDSATVDATMRADWWVAYEAKGAVAGFYYSRIAGGNRLNTDQPLGPGFASISDGYNHLTNRTALTSNNGSWPNLIRFDRMDTNDVAQGQSLPATLLYQWTQPSTAMATVSFYLDADLNPLNGNEYLLGQSVVYGSFATMQANVNIPLNATNIAPGIYALYAKITAGGRSRYLYAKEAVRVISSVTLDISSLASGGLQIGINGSSGQTVVLDVSPDLRAWQPLATNTLNGARWIYQDGQVVEGASRFYRARLR